MQAQWLQALASRKSAALSWAPALVGVAALGFRLANLDLAPFIQDEPIFLEAARFQHQPSGKWASASPIPGTQGFTYGPSPIWFYGAVQLLFGDSARASIGAMCAFVTLAHLVLALSLTFAFKRGPVFFGLLAAFIAALPYQFMWSRLAWDQLVNACSCLLLALIVGPRPLASWRCAALGLVAGISLSSHLMVTPLLILLGLALFVEHVRAPRELLRLGLFAVPCLVLVNIPYLIFLSCSPLPGLAPLAPLDGPALLTRVLEIVRVATPSGIEYFFDADWPDFIVWLGFDPTAISAALVPVLLGLTVTGLLLALLFERGPAQVVAGLGMSVLVFYPLFYRWKQLPLEPHYQFPTWWVVPLGVACLLAWAFRSPWRAWLVGSVVLSISCAQLFFIVRWVAYVEARGGTRGVHYSTPVAQTAAAVRTACTTDAQTVLLENATVVFPVSLRYHAATEPRCAGKLVTVCSGPCPAPPGARLFLLAYAHERGAAISVHDRGRVPAAN